MGLTSSDINKVIYFKLREKGLTHKQAIDQFPKDVDVENDLNKTTIESHFGMTEKQFFILVGFIIGTIVLIPLILLFLTS